MDHDLRDCPGDGLVIGADGITLDLNGHAITGSGRKGAGVRNEGHDNVTIKNGFIGGVVEGGGFETGVVLTDGADHNRIRRLTAEAILYGIALFDSDRNRIERSVGQGFGPTPCSPGNTTAGIALFRSDKNLISGSPRLELTGFGILLVDSERNRIRNNAAAFEGSDGNACDGIALFDSDKNRIEANEAYENGDGIKLDSRSSGNFILRNDASENGDDGIDCDNPDNLAARNITRDNGDRGIEGCRVR